jgi:REP element-mobilizing transposase RayT
MSTHTQIMCHIVFGTKNRTSSLVTENRTILFKYCWGVLKNKKCHVYRINGVDDHIHILTHIHPTVALSDLIKDLKLASNAFIKKKNLFPTFKGWQQGYSAFTHHIDDKNRLINYIKNQEEHHQKVSWPEELKALLKEHRIKFNERFLV